MKHMIKTAFSAAALTLVIVGCSQKPEAQYMFPATSAEDGVRKLASLSKDSGVYVAINPQSGVAAIIVYQEPGKVCEKYTHGIGHSCQAWKTVAAQSKITSVAVGVIPDQIRSLASTANSSENQFAIIRTANQINTYLPAP